MKNLQKRIALIMLSVLTVLSLSGCGAIGKTTYTANSGFYYSNDKGHSYGDGTKEYAVGETVYMKVIFKVNSNKKKKTLKNMCAYCTLSIWTGRLSRRTLILSTM